MFILIILVAVVALVLLYDYVNKSTRVWKLLCQFPGPPTLPLVGNALELGLTPKDIQTNLARLWRKYNMKNFRLMLGSEPMLFICEHNDAKKILSNSIMIDKSDQQIHYFREAFGDSLVQSTGEKWRTMRKLLNPLFHPSLLEEHLKISNSKSQILIEKLRAHVDGSSFDSNPYLINFGIDVFCSAMLGIEANVQDGGEQEYAQATRKILPLVIKRFYSPWLRYDFLYKMSALRRESQKAIHTMNMSLDRFIDFRQKEFEKKVVPVIENEEDIVKYISKNRRNLTFVDVMLLTKMPNGQSIPRAWIKEETNLLMFAGFDTTQSTMGFALVHLAKYKDLQQKVYDEQKAIFGLDRNREPTIQELGEMVYLQRFVKESMRVQVTVGQFGRKLKHDVTFDDGRTVAAGTNVTFYLPGLNLNPEYFPNPEVFDPDRFLEPVSPYLYMPFGAGLRICIGYNFAWMEVRSMLSHVVRNFELSHAGPHDDVIPVQETVNYSMNGFRIMLKERK